MLGLSCSTIPMKFSLDNLTITPSFTIGYTLFIKCNSGVLYPCLIWFLYWLRCMKFFLWATLFFPSDTNLGQIRSVVFLSVQLSNTDAKSDLVVHKRIHHTRGRKVKMLFRYFPVISSELFPAIITHVDQRRPALPELFVICPCVSLFVYLSLLS